VRRVRFLVWKELIELRRDPRLFAIVILAPVIQLFLLAYAATTDVRNVPLVIADADRSTRSRELVARFDRSPAFSLIATVVSPHEVDAYLERGDAWIGVAIPGGFGSSLAGGRAQTVQVLADGSDANSAGLALGYATSLIGQYGQELAALPSIPTAGASGTGGGEVLRGSLEPRVRVWFNPRLQSRDFMIPGIVALLLLVVTTNLSSMGIVREREHGTLEQLNVTPIGRWELIAGKLVPYGLIGLIDVVLVLAVATLWFEVPMRGSVTLLFATSVLYLVATLGLGLFVSTISSTQQQAMMSSVFFFMMPMVLLSGFVFPIENMPQAMQAVTYLVPLRYFLVMLRSIFLKGVGLEVWWPQALALAGWTAGILLLAIARSSKRSA
jgi:ABC-2 type transport system permease protein